MFSVLPYLTYNLQVFSFLTKHNLKPTQSQKADKEILKMTLEFLPDAQNFVIVLFSVKAH